MKILFRVDGGPRVGLGHLQRCLSLAAAFRRKGLDSIFVTNADPRVAERVDRSGFESRFLEGGIPPWREADLAKTVALGSEHRCGVVVVDSDEEGADYTRGLREAGLFVCALEDVAPHPFPCQMVVNGDAHAEGLPYQAENGGQTQFYLGTRYSILRPEFWNVAVRSVQSSVKKVLVILGGVDPLSQMPGVLRLLGGLGGKFTVTAIVGPFFKNRQTIEEVAEASPALVTLVENPEEMFPWMEEADLAVSAAGQTLYELVCAGCPTVAFSVASNQQGQLLSLAKAGCVRNAGDARRMDVLPSIREHLLDLIHHRERRAEMARVGQQRVDGQGALRVAGAVMALAASRIVEAKTSSGAGAGGSAATRLSAEAGGYG